MKKKQSHVPNQQLTNDLDELSSLEGLSETYRLMSNTYSAGTIEQTSDNPHQGYNNTEQ